MGGREGDLLCGVLSWVGKGGRRGGNTEAQRHRERTEGKGSGGWVGEGGGNTEAQMHRERTEGKGWEGLGAVKGRSGASGMFLEVAISDV